MNRRRWICLIAAFLFALGAFVPAKATHLLVCRVTGHVAPIVDTPDVATVSLPLDDCCEEEESPGAVRLIKSSCCDLLPASFHESASSALSSVKENVNASFAVLLPMPVIVVKEVDTEAIPQAIFSVSAPPRAPPLSNSIAPRAPPAFFS